jgi:hypothetical protein
MRRPHPTEAKHESTPATWNASTAWRRAPQGGETGHGPGYADDNAAFAFDRSCDVEPIEAPTASRNR